MNLLQLLLGAMLSNNSVNTVSQQNGTNNDLTKKLLMIAIPLLIRYMTKNAQSQSGAQSLLGALTQHKNQNDMVTQLQQADKEDGKNIIGHILGNDQTQVVNNLAQETGMESNQVMDTLSTIAPALLSGLSAATTQQQQPQNDLSGLASLFGASQPVEQKPSGLGALASLFGGSQPQQSSLDGSDLLSALLSMKQ